MEEKEYNSSFKYKWQTPELSNVRGLRVKRKSLELSIIVWWGVGSGGSIFQTMDVNAICYLSNNEAFYVGYPNVPNLFMAGFS